MGAVFSLLAGYYYWSSKMIGYKYNEILGKIQFYTLFIGVNLVFGPMHFLGISGQPRRISDYPDAFAGWNYIASVGSMITLISIFLFIYIIYRQFTDKILESENTLTNLYSGYNGNLFQKKTLPHFFERDLEFAINTPPKFHAFEELPVM